MLEGFGSRLKESIDTKKSAVVVGLDPDIRLFPSSLKRSLHDVSGPAWYRGAAELVFEFGRLIIDAVFDIVPAIKPQAAFYERFGPPGLEALRRTIEYAHGAQLLVILDAKRNDIESTATAYADAYLGPLASTSVDGCPFDVDALTINAYLGSDGVQPFVNAAAARSKGVFVLVKTSNPSAAEFQDLSVLGGPNGPEPLYHFIARKVDQWGAACIDASGYSAVGAVVGATYPREASLLRGLMPRAFFLVPGVGAQGGDVSHLAVFFDKSGSGALVSASRSLIYAYLREPTRDAAFQQLTREATLELRASVERVRAEAAQSRG